MVYFSSTSILSSCVTCKAKYMVSKFSTQDYCWSSLLINICIKNQFHITATELTGLFYSI